MTGKLGAPGGRGRRRRVPSQRGPHGDGTRLENTVLQARLLLLFCALINLLWLHGINTNYSQRRYSYTNSHSKIVVRLLRFYRFNILFLLSCSSPCFWGHAFVPYEYHFYQVHKTRNTLPLMQRPLFFTAVHDL